MYSSLLRPTPPLKNTFMNVQTKPPNFPTVVYVLFLTLLYGFGLDFGAKKLLRKKIRIITKWFQMFTSLVIMILQVLEVTREQICEYYSYFHIISYFLHYLFLYRTKYTVFDLVNDIHSLIDNQIIVVKNRVSGIICIFTIIILVPKYSICVLNHVLNKGLCQNNVIPGYITCIPIVIIDGLAIILILINYYIYISLKYIKKTTKEVDTIVLLDNFMVVADCWDKIKHLYTKMVVIELSMCTPKLIETMLAIAISIKENDMSTSLRSAVTSLIILLQLCGPAILVEKIKLEVEAIKLELHNQLLLDRDELKTEERNRFLTYISARNLQYEIWNFIPIDLKLPISVLGISVSYFLILIQFKHTFD